MIRLSKSSITESEKEAVIGVLDREFLGMGQEVKTFEEMLTEFFRRPALCVINGTAALHLACQAISLMAEDEILVPSLTYVASFQAISATGAKPIPCDIIPETLTLDWKDAEKRLTKLTKAVMPVHYSGGVGNIEEIYNFASRHGLRVIEDAAHAFGTTFKGKRVGSFGDIACFSFDGIKNITSGEGGCIVTDDRAIIKKISDARLLGVENDTQKRFDGKRSWDFDVTRQGWRYHMSNIMAAIGIEQLRRFEEMAAQRQALSKIYDSIFVDVDRIRSINHDYSSVVPHIYVVVIDGLTNREAVREKMLDQNIQTGTHYRPNHYLSYYRDSNTAPLPITERIYPEILSLPLHPDMDESDVHRVCQALLDSL